jgi:NADH-quinone oxidoreductase subunit M
VILAAVYMLWMFQRVMFGTIHHKENEKLVDLNGREMATLIPLVVLIFWIGLYPKPFLDTMDASLRRVLNQAGAVVAEPMIQGHAEAPEGATGPGGGE